jgi:nucleoside-diphosphate-sugar epimerase
MKLFVTGGSGFVGYHFIKAALNAGHSVRAVRRHTSKTDLVSPMLEWIVIELDKIKPIHFENCDVLIHFAAAGVSPKQASRQEMMYWNVVVTQLLLEEALNAGLKRMVVAGSFAEYGKSANTYDFIPSHAPLLPLTSYASSKAACFVTSYSTAIELGIELAYLRIFSAYGQGQSENNFWPALRKAALDGSDFSMTSGEQIRDFISVVDVAAAFLHAATRKDIHAGVPLVCNVGTGIPVAIRDFAEHLWRLWGATGVLKIGSLPYRSNEIMRFVPLVSEADNPHILLK